MPSCQIFEECPPFSENVSSRLPAIGRLLGSLSPYWPAAYCLAHAVTPSPRPDDQQGCTGRAPIGSTRWCKSLLKETVPGRATAYPENSNLL